MTRRDALPEAAEYRDTGCDVAPACLSCHLPRCRYDVPGGIRALERAERNAAIRLRLEDGATVDQVAEEFGLSARNVFRARRAS